jgi:hypothetical protein
MQLFNTGADPVMSSETREASHMRKHLVMALERTEGITPMVTPRRQQVRESEKGEGETISLLKGLPEEGNTKARWGIPRRLLLQQQQKQEGERVSSPEGFRVAADASLHHRWKRVGAEDAISAEDPHRSL